MEKLILKLTSASTGVGVEARAELGTYQIFLASLKGGDYPQLGKTLHFFRFFLMKASLSQRGRDSLFSIHLKKGYFRPL